MAPSLDNSYLFFYFVSISFKSVLIVIRSVTDVIVTEWFMTCYPGSGIVIIDEQQVMIKICWVLLSTTDAVV